MKLFAQYDVSGKIRSLTWANPPRGVSVMLAPRPGELIAEVEDHHLTGTMPTEKSLRDLANSHVIQTPGARCKLAKKG
jgi:hypothetical protein